MVPTLKNAHSGYSSISPSIIFLKPLTVSSNGTYLPGIDGEVQILTNHEECVVALKTGEVRIGTPKGEMIPAVCGSGFAEVTSDNQVEILVDTIERPEEIDIRRAKEAKERAEERLLQHKSRMEYYRNTTSLARAMARLKEANKYRH